MGFDIRPGMSIWNSMSKKYKKEYYIYAAKMEKRKFENDRKLKQINKKKLFRKKLFPGRLNKTATIKEKMWFAWMD